MRRCIDQASSRRGLYRPLRAGSKVAHVGFDIRALIDERRGQAALLHEEHLNPQVPKVLKTIGFDREFVRAEGAYYWDPEGHRYLDYLSGFGVYGVGRNHPV